jgi:hypothetical protein
MCLDKALSFPVAIRFHWLQVLWHSSLTDALLIFNTMVIVNYDMKAFVVFTNSLSVF